MRRAGNHVPARCVSTPDAYRSHRVGTAAMADGHDGTASNRLPALSLGDGSTADNCHVGYDGELLQWAHALAHTRTHNDDLMTSLHM